MKTIHDVRTQNVSRSYSVHGRTFLYTCALTCFLMMTANAQFIQQGSKLVGAGGVGGGQQGISVSLSAGGNTALVGGNLDNGDAGAAWVYTWSGGVWAQQGVKLVGTGAVGNAHQGTSVSLSSDGNTAMVGGPADNGDAGAVWVYTRSGSVWTQQGNKLVGTGAVGNAKQGTSVSLSSDGNTAIVGGPDDGSGAGAVWVYTRSGGVWSQQGNKLVGTGAVGNALQGCAVSLSSSGNTAVVGGYGDNVGGGVIGAGAVWVFTRSGGVWTQQGNKLVGAGAVGNAQQGYSVSLSSDGNTVLVGGNYDDIPKGAAWVFTRSAGVWTQQGGKLYGTGVTGSPLQGWSVSLSSDGNRAMVGGLTDNNKRGAVWVYMRGGGVWTQQGSKLVGTGAVNGSNGAIQGASVSLSSDGYKAIVGGPGDNNYVGAVWAFAVPFRSIANGNWSAAATWSHNRSPIVGDVVAVASGNTVVLDVDPAAETITVNSGGTLSLSSSRTLSCPLSVNGTLSINSGGVLTNNGTLDLNVGGNLILNRSSASIPGGTFHWNGGTVTIKSAGSVDVSNALIIPAGGTLSVDGALSINSGGTITNGGTVNLNTGGRLYLNAILASIPAGTFNWSGSTITVGGGASLSLSRSFVVPTGAALVVDGVMTISSGDTLTANYSSFIGIGSTGNLINSGTLIVGGELHNNAGGNITNTSGGSLEIGSYGTLLNSFNGTMTNNGGGIITNSGELFNDVHGTITNNGSLTNNAGGYVFNVNTFTNNGTFTNRNVFGNGGQFNLNAGGIFVLDKLNASLPGIAFNWNSGGTVIIGSNGSLRMASSLAVQSGRTLQVAGILTVASGDTLTIDAGSAFTINAGGTLVDSGTVINNSTLINNGIVTNSTNGVLVNNSTLVSKGTLNNTGTLSTVGTLISSNLNNSGSLNLNTFGNLVLTANPTSIPGGIFNWNSGSTITIDTTGNLIVPGSFSVPFGRTLQVNGALTNGGTIAVNGRLILDSTVTNSGTLNLNSGGNLILTASVASIPGGTFHWNTGGTVTIGDGGSLAIPFPLIIPPGDTLTVAANGRLTFNTGGSLINSGKLSLMSGGSIVMNKDTTFIPAGNFSWGGELVIGASSHLTVSDLLEIPMFGSLRIRGYLNNTDSIIINGALNIESTGTFSNNGTIVNYQSLTNEGTFDLESGSTYITEGGGFLPSFNWKNGSTVKIGTYAYVELYVNLGVELGRILIVDGILENYGFNVTNNGILKGSGSLSASFPPGVSGIFAPGNSVGKLSVWGDLNFGSSEYRCEIDGAADTSDVLAISGQATLTNATLKVIWLTNPVAGATYTVITFGSRTGTFATVAVPPVEGFLFTTAYTATAVTITALVAPTIVWTGATSSDWNTASNWVGGVVPGSTNSVSFPSSGTPYAVVISSTISVAHITLGTNCALTLSTGGSLAVNGIFTINAGATLNAGSSTITLKGNWSNSGTLNAGTGKFILNGTAVQTMSGSTFNDLEINNAAGVTMLTNENVNGILTFTSGNLTLGANNLNLGASATVSGAAATKCIVTSGTGTVSRAIAASGSFQFPIGATATSYNPVTITLQAADPTETFSTRAQVGFTGLVAPTDTTVVVNRAWIITEGTPGGNNATVTLQYNTGEFMLAAFSPVTNWVARYDGTQWMTTSASATYPSGGPFTSSASGFTAFSPFAITSNTSALPVQLASFAGIFLGSSVRLNWRTLSEINNYGFYVQRKRQTDSTFTELPNSFIAGHGTTNAPHDYSFTHTNVGSGSWQYRLKQVDLDGAIHFTEPIEIGSPTSVKELAPIAFALKQNYPNPFNPTTEIKFSVEATDHARLEVYNITGQRVATLFDDVAEAGQYYKVRFDAGRIASGVYFYRLQSGKKSELKRLLLLK